MLTPSWKTAMAAMIIVAIIAIISIAWPIFVGIIVGFLTAVSSILRGLNSVLREFRRLLRRR